MQAIGKVHSPYKEKFAIPRQPGLVSAAKGKIELVGEFNQVELVRDLENYSHIWVVFIFHGTQAQGWKPLVRPPRLGGNKKTGVLATRSTFRPNPIGMSVVKLEGIEHKNKKVYLTISGLDLLDQTPVIDIKPYLPYVDAIADAQAGFAQQAPESKLTISFNENSKQFLAKAQAKFPELSQLIEQVLAQDPRPAYKKSKLDNNAYAMTLYHFNINWQMTSLSSVEVTAITELSTSN
ncbi:tRNA (N6-threonylcarbamoyladenosine(37)-N6)-methyltransferase TrmO [Thalassotalea sp. PLHSN55]|uniref:tRNA (N6-threonylcarbamoyladenosine(37)-N6)-methyltransferase TrmO n=1 Tax=Thalassotalea sp. PLHSN55 TaxID=3435888 RepID=UPI003F848CAC